MLNPVDPRGDSFAGQLDAIRQLKLLAKRLEA
jgi:hypothetical protein